MVTDRQTDRQTDSCLSRLRSAHEQSEHAAPLYESLRHEKEGNKMPTPTQRVIHNPIPTSFVSCKKAISVPCLHTRSAIAGFLRRAYTQSYTLKTLFGSFLTFFVITHYALYSFLPLTCLASHSPTSLHSLSTHQPPSYSLTTLSSNLRSVLEHPHISG